MIRRVSKKRAADNIKYKEAYDLWKPEHEYCEVCGRHVEYGVPPHHRKGRTGKLLYETKFWMCVCHNCHSNIESYRAWAIEKGYLILR